MDISGITSSVRELSGLGAALNTVVAYGGRLLNGIVSIPSWIYQAWTKNSITHAGSQQADKFDRGATADNANDADRLGQVLANDPDLPNRVRAGTAAQSTINSATGGSILSYLNPLNWFSSGDTSPAQAATTPQQPSGGMIPPGATTAPAYIPIVQAEQGTSFLASLKVPVSSTNATAAITGGTSADPAAPAAPVNTPPNTDLASAKGAGTNLTI